MRTGDTTNRDSLLSTPLRSVLSGSIILDNATLRGALIALGVLDPPNAVEERSIKILDIHVACAELLIESILLHNHIYLPSVHAKDYPDTVLKMQSLIGRDILRELPLSDADTSTIEQFAEQDFKSWPVAEEKLRQRLREFAGTEAPIISWDRWIHSQYNSASAWKAWNSYTHSISDYYINQLDVPSRDSIHSLPLKPQLPNTEQVDAAILWIAYRTCVYDCIAWGTGISYVPHPQRASLWKAINLRRSQPILFTETPYDVLFDVRASIGTQLNKAVGMQAFDLTIPPFFTYILSKSNSASEILDVTLDLRNNTGIVELRNVLKEISENLFRKGSVSKIQKLTKDFEKLKQDLTVEYYVATAPKITPNIQVVGIFGAEFDTTMPRQLAKMLSKLRTINKPHLAVLRDIFKTTTDVWRLSHLYDKLFLGGRTLSTPSIAPPRIVQFPPTAAVPNKRGDWYITLEIEDPEYEAPNECRRELDDFLSSYPDHQSFLAIIDIDNMDHINELCGHKHGDVVIHRVALSIRKAGFNLISKVSGDTFIAIHFGEVDDLEEILRQRITRTSFFCNQRGEWFVTDEPDNLKAYETWGMTKVSLSVSIGSAYSSRDDSTADSLFRIAFTRLRQEKMMKREQRL